MSFFPLIGSRLEVSQPVNQSTYSQLQETERDIRQIAQSTFPASQDYPLSSQPTNSCIYNASANNINLSGGASLSVSSTHNTIHNYIVSNLSEHSLSISQSGPSFQESFISRLKNHYLMLNTLTIFTPQMNSELEREIPLDSLYTNLAMIGDDERKERKEGLESVIDGRLPTYETIFRAKKEISPEEMFTQEKLRQSAQKRVVVYGSAGIGKSTFVSYATHAWAEGKLWPEFEVVLCIRLRDLSESFFRFERGYTYTPYDFLKREYETLQLDFQDLLNDSHLLNKTLLILDGYDELPAETGSNRGHLYRAFEGLKKLFPHLLITSRPGSVNITCNCEFEILGFNDAQIDKYMTAFFDHVQENNRGNFQKLRAYLDKTPLAKSLAHIPINLTMLCSLFQDNSNFFEGETPLTITCLYNEIVNHFFKLFLFKSGKGNDDVTCKKPVLHPSVIPLTTILEKCAFEAMKDKSLYMDQTKIEKVVFGKGLELTQVKPVGLFRIENKKGSFIHLTFQEYFAANYIARLYTENKRTEAQKIWRKHKFKPHFNLVWRMTAGILSLQGNIKRLQEFFDDLFTAPNDFSVRTELELIARCFEECHQRENMKQYGSFITACEEYVEKFIPLEDSVGFVFNLFGPNSSLLQHPKIVKLITDLCQGAHSNETYQIIRNIARMQQPVPKEVLETLIKLLLDPQAHSFAKQAGAHTLGVISQGRGALPKEVLEALMQLLWNPQADSDAKRTAAQALGAIAQGGGVPAKEALEALIQFILDPKADSDAKRAGAGALGAIAPGRGALPKEVLEALMQLLWNPQADSYAKWAAAEALGKIVQAGGALPKEALEALMQILRDPKADSDAKWAGAKALGKIAQGGGVPAKEALEALIQLIRDPQAHSDAKRAAAQALGTIAQAGGALPKEALEALMQLIQDPKAHSYTKQAAAEALGAIAQGEGALPKEVLEALMQLLWNPQAESYAKRAAAQALGAIAQGRGALAKEALEALIQLIRDPQGDSYAKRASAKALGAIAQGGGALPKEALEALMQLLRDPQAHSDAKQAGAEALDAIAQAGGALAKEALEALIQLIRDPQAHSDAKWAAAQALGTIAQAGGALPKEALEALTQLLRDPHANLGAKTAGAQALGAIAQGGGELSKELSQRLPDILQGTQVISATYPYLIQIFQKFSTDTIISETEKTLGLDVQFCLFNGFALSLENDRLCIWDREGKCFSSEGFRPPSRISSDSSSSSATSNQTNLSLSVSLSQATYSSANPPEHEIQGILFDKGELCQTLLGCYKKLHSITKDII